MTDVLDVMYRLRDMAGTAANQLRIQIAEAQTVLDKLDKFANDAQDVAELAGASDIFPDTVATIPQRAGLVHGERAIMATDATASAPGRNAGRAREVLEALPQCGHAWVTDVAADEPTYKCSWCGEVRKETLRG